MSGIHGNNDCSIIFTFPTVLKTGVFRTYYEVPVLLKYNFPRVKMPVRQPADCGVLAHVFLLPVLVLVVTVLLLKVS